MTEIGIPSAELLFDLDYFEMDPDPFYKYAHKLMPNDTGPSLSHAFISMLEEKGKLLRNYTQNVDGLERKAGISRLVECHGSMDRFRCMKCRKKVGRGAVVEEIAARRVPMCPCCRRGVLVSDPSSLMPCFSHIYALYIYTCLKQACHCVHTP